MCGRYTLAATVAELESRFGVSFPTDAAPRYNAAPSEELAVVTGEEARGMEWGLTPSWADESFDLINARAETITDKRSFADAYERRRCLVPADGFYEWADTPDGKHPYRVAFEDDRVFAMAGIYERWQPPTTQTGLGAFTDDGEADTDPVETFAVVTTEPNAVVSDLHHRMAVILPPDRESDWLTADPDDARDLLRPHPPDEMHSYRVTDAVGDPSNDGPELLEPVESASD
ncbi:MAG: SOS response-associated peptidase [Halobaculum sp.]